MSRSPNQSAPMAGKKWVALLTVLPLITAYSIIEAEGRSMLFALSCWLQMAICTSFVLIEQPRETLAPAKVMILLYTASFAIAPLWLADLNIYRNRYYGNDVEALMGLTATMALIGQVFFLAGYYLVTRLFSEIRPTAHTIDRKKNVYIRVCALTLAGLGLLFYFLLISESGGIGFLMGYAGSRADIFGNAYGGWFWGTHLLFAAYG